MKATLTNSLASLVLVCILGFACQPVRSVSQKPITTMSNDTTLLSAQVVLKTKSGKSLRDAAGSVNSSTIGDYKPRKTTVKKAQKLLEKAGFTVYPSDVSLSIVGSKDLFEKYFQTEFDTQTRDAQVFYIPKKTCVLPKDLATVAESVEVSPPLDFKY